MECLYYRSPIGLLLLEADGAGLCAARLVPAAGQDAPGPTVRQAAGELAEYFAGRRKVFGVPLSLHGTAFQLRAWAALQAIPYGQTRSYAEQAAAIGNPKACRAVGMANHRNPVIIIVPCHRVIGADGSLVGYGGGLAVKRALLDLEARFR